MNIRFAVFCSLIFSTWQMELVKRDRSPNADVIFLDLTNIDHANGAEIPKNYAEEETKIIPTNIDFAALKEVYAKENKAERFLPSRLFFEEDKKRK